MYWIPPLTRLDDRLDPRPSYAHHASAVTPPTTAQQPRRRRRVPLRQWRRRCRRSAETRSSPQDGRVQNYTGPEYLCTVLQTIQS